jgi:lysozyme
LTPEEAAKAAVLASAVGQEKQETEGGPKGLFDRLKEAVKSKSSGLLESFGAAMGGTAAGAALAKHGIKGAAMAGIGKLAGGAAWLGRTAIVSGALAGLKGLALTTGALVSSPVVIGLVTAAAVGYGVYKLYGAYKRNTFPSTPAKFFQIRKQSLYAIQMPVDDSIIYQMEMDILSSQPSPEDPGMAIRPITDAMIRGYMRQFKTLNPKNPTHYATFKHWYEHRFTPVFEQFIRIMSHYNTYRSKLQPPQPPLDYIAVHRAVKGTDDYNYFMAATTQIKPQRSDIVLSKSAADGFFSNAAAYGATSMYKDRGEQMMQYIENQGPDSQDFGTKDASTPRSRSSNPRARNTGADKAWKALEAETKVYSKDETTSSYNQLREKTKAWIKGHEGLRFKPYLDSLQFNTIGYGHKNIHGLTYVDKATADALFERDFAKAESLASQLPMYAQLDPVRRMALVNMVFNMGLGQSPSTGFAGSGVRSFKRALTALEMATSVEDPTQRNKLFDEAAKEVLSSKYATQVKDRAKNVAEVLKTGKIQMMKVKPINVTDHERDSLDKDTLASLKQSKFASEDYDKQYTEQAVKDVADNPTFTPKQMAAQTMTDFSKSKVGISVSANKISVIVDGISFFNGSFEHYQEFLLKQYGDQGSVPDSLRYFTQGNAQVDVFKLVSHKPKVKEETANRFKSVAKPNISAAEAMAAGMGVPQLELKMDEGELADNTRESNTILQGIHEVLSKLLYKAENPDKEVPKEPVKPPQPPVRGARRTNTGPKTITVPFPT